MTAVAAHHPHQNAGDGNIVVSAGTSFLLGTAINYVFSGMQIAEGLAGGYLTALMSLVDSVTGPIFKRHLGDGLVSDAICLAASFLICTAAIPTIGSMAGIALKTNFFWTVYFRNWVGGLFVAGGILVGALLCMPRDRTRA